MFPFEPTFSNVLEHWEVFGIAPGEPEQVPGWPMMPVGGAGQPMGHLDLRFPMHLEHLSIWTYVFQCFGALGRSRSAPVQ